MAIRAVDPAVQAVSGLRGGLKVIVPLTARHRLLCSLGCETVQGLCEGWLTVFDCLSSQALACISMAVRLSRIVEDYYSSVEVVLGERESRDIFC